MPKLFWEFVGFLLRAVISLRYRVEYRGLEKLNTEHFNKKGGILFLPNHPAHMDPFMIYARLWPRFRMQPLVVEYIFRNPLLKPIMQISDAMPVPNLDVNVNQLKVKKAQDAIQRIADGLKQGKNFLLYPAGSLKSSGRESVGGASGAHALSQECKEANIVLIRTTGLWGSSFSRAYLGRTPPVGAALWFGFCVLMKNLLFFAPRRKVLIEIEPNPPGLPREGSRLEFNRFLDAWYNQYLTDQGRVEEEPATRVSYAFWRKDLKELYQPKRKRKGEGGVEISEEVQSKVAAEIQKILNNPAQEIRPEMSLAQDLGMDSLNIAELIAFLSKKYDVGEIHPEDLDTVQDALELASGASSDKDRVNNGPSLFSWPAEEARPEPCIPAGATIPEAFLSRCDSMGNRLACADDLVGVLSYKKMKKSILVLAQYFRTFPEERVAVLLPASAGAYIVILALQMAGKTPVMLNWTLGPRYLEEMMRLTGAKRVLTSWRFLDRASHIDLGQLVDQLLLLEDVRASLSLKMKLRGVFLSFLSKKAVLKAQGLTRLQGDSPAVILFTSGTEAAPKAVPLTYKNILSNQSSAIQGVCFKSTDVLYGILPPFHSFGFSVTGIFPLLIGMKVAFYPDPTDSFALAEGVKRWNVSIFCSAPSFLKGLFAAEKGDDLKSIRMFVTGAEKASAELVARATKRGAVFIEGYGITECSPILTMTREGLPLKGVGQPLPGVDVCTIHPETGALLPPGAAGELCFRGPNVFNGYLGSPRNPFIEIEGKQWYRSGDIGMIDSEGFLILTGRLKRFTKIGGEMISLGAVEEVLIKELLQEGKIKSDLPSLAILADERNPEKSQLVLFSTAAIDRDHCNEILNRAGFSRLIKISAVYRIEEIPMMGTGKTDYRTLQAQIK